MYSSNIHNRRSIRLNNYDYSDAGLYFITLCTTNRENIFGEIMNGKMHFNAFGAIAKEEWEKTPEIRKNITLGEFIIMPNHFHAIISIDYKLNKGESQFARTDKNTPGFHSPSQTIGAIIRGFKGATTKKINNLIRELREDKDGSTGVLKYAPTNAPTKINLSGEGSIWQRNYYEHIIKSEKAFSNISNYIIKNPLNWENDKLK